MRCTGQGRMRQDSWLDPSSEWSDGRMHQTMDIDTLTGLEFLDLASRQERACASRTAKELPGMGRNAPACLEQLGQALNTLSGAAGCRWGCAKGDHLIEYLLGRAASNGHAAYRLFAHGFYDESMALARSIGELANLLLLFGQDSSSFSNWRLAPRRERLAKFSPMKVRAQLEQLHSPLGIDRDRYAALCEVGVHATPDTKPNLHSPDRRPRLGAYFQLPGALVALNELAYAIGLAMAGGCRLMADKNVQNRLQVGSVNLIRSIGSVTIMNLGEALESMRHQIENQQNDPPTV